MGWKRGEGGRFEDSMKCAAAYPDSLPVAVGRPKRQDARWIIQLASKGRSVLLVWQAARVVVVEESMRNLEGGSGSIGALPSSLLAQALAEAVGLA